MVEIYNCLLRHLNVTEAFYWWLEWGLKHQPATSTTVENLETEVLGMLTLMDADSLACDCGILGLDAPEQKKGNHKVTIYLKAAQF